MQLILQGLPLLVKLVDGQRWLFWADSWLQADAD